MSNLCISREPSIPTEKKLFFLISKNKLIKVHFLSHPLASILYQYKNLLKNIKRTFMLNRTGAVSYQYPNTKRKMSTPTSDGSPPPEFFAINFAADRYPYCIVWTPIPVLTWFFPFIGHMGIAMSNGVIRDFAGSYLVSEDNMAFGRPTRYLQLSLDNVVGGQYEWDEAISKASVLYGTRMHNLFCDNCHSHVAAALIGMRYKGRTNWNMIILAFWIFFRAKFVGVMGFVKTFLPFAIVVSLCVILSVYM